MAGGSRTEQLLSRIAAGDGHSENSSYFDGWKAYETNPYDPRLNRDGVIQMGLAENQVRTVPLPQLHHVLSVTVILSTPDAAVGECSCKLLACVAAVAGTDRAMDHGAPGGVHLHGAGRVGVPEDSQLPGLPRPAGVQRGN